MSGLDLLVSFGAMPKETRSTERNRAHKQLGNAGGLILEEWAMPIIFAGMARSHRYCTDVCSPHFAGKALKSS